MNIPPTRSYQKFLFLFFVTAIYSALVIWLNFLKGPGLWDEHTFWATSLTFSDRLIPSLDDLRNYGELNTPLPFIIFGALEYLFHQGIFAGRLLNLILSLSIVFIIGWPIREKRGSAILCAAGLLLCPYYLFLSGRLYTEMVACFWVLMGFVSYVHNRHFLSGMAFTLAIASRQFMLPFPVAVATYEFIMAIAIIKRSHKISWVEQRRWIAPSIAALSILGWIYLFQGLAPEAAMDTRTLPAVQQTPLAFRPSVAINFLTYTGLYIAIPEFILFRPLARLRSLPQSSRKIAIAAIVLLILFLLFPPHILAHGNLSKVLLLLPDSSLRVLVFYSLALLACVRFFQPNLTFLIIFFNSLIMIKAQPWDKYVLPLAVVFWYLKSVRFEENLTSFHRQKRASVPKLDVVEALPNNVR